MGGGIACAICGRYGVENHVGADGYFGERCRYALRVELLMPMIVGSLCVGARLSNVM